MAVSRLKRRAKETDEDIYEFRLNSALNRLFFEIHACRGSDDACRGSLAGGRQPHCGWTRGVGYGGGKRAPFAILSGFMFEDGYRVPRVAI